MRKKKENHEAIDHQLAALFGDPPLADAQELEDVCEEINGAADLVQLAYDLAVHAAQQCRLAGKSVPPHVEAALAQMKKSNTLEGTPPAKLGAIVDSVMKPFLGPATRLAFNYHRLKDKSEKDERLLERLAEEVKQDWRGEDKDNEGG